tara:strand:+ start:2009 stop:2179 length:171 start_codon:yes stop_codon:yes gene_type:complete
MDLNHRSPGYEPDGISRLPHLADLNATVLPFETTDVVFFSSSFGTVFIKDDIQELP